MKPKSLHEQHKELFAVDSPFKPKTIALKKKVLEEKRAKKEVAEYIGKSSVRGEGDDDGTDDI